jgi:hypothetical protein
MRVVVVVVAAAAVVVYFVMDSVRKLFDTLSYIQLTQVTVQHWIFVNTVLYLRVTLG